MLGQELDIVLLGMKGGGTDLEPGVWFTARELPFQSSPMTQETERSIRSLA